MTPTDWLRAILLIVAIAGIDHAWRAGGRCRICKTSLTAWEHANDERVCYRCTP